MKNKILGIISFIIIIGIMVVIYIYDNKYPEIDIEWHNLSELISVDLNNDGEKKTVSVIEEQLIANPVANKITINVNGQLDEIRTAYEIDPDNSIGFVDINSDGVKEILINVKSIEESEDIIPTRHYRIYNYQNDKLYFLGIIPSGTLQYKEKNKIIMVTYETGNYQNPNKTTEKFNFDVGKIILKRETSSQREKSSQNNEEAM